ncbi:MAG: hypothetical protein NZ517_08235 [Candidatus Nitrosocaldus sp.]|nr:hypothetical protein [Candidatus Nitrosocaldus sp.]
MYECCNCAYRTCSEEKIRRHAERSKHRYIARVYPLARNRKGNGSSNNGSNSSGNGNSNSNANGGSSSSSNGNGTKEAEIETETTGTETMTTTITATEQETADKCFYRCRSCEFVIEVNNDSNSSNREIEEEAVKKHEKNTGHVCEQVILASKRPYQRYLEWLQERKKQEVEERSRQEKRRREREYEEFKNTVYEAFTTFAARFFRYAQQAQAFIGQMLEAGTGAWKLPYLYQFLDNEPYTKGTPELATMTWRSLLLLAIPTFPSGRHSNRIEKVHVIAIEVLDKVDSREIEERWKKWLRLTISERIGRFYEVEAITHMVFALEGENLHEVVDRKDIPNYSIEPAPLQSKPLYSNYEKGGKIKRLIVGDCKRTLVFIGRNVYEKVMTALWILMRFYSAKAAGMLHDDSLTTSRVALREQIMLRAFQNYNSIRQYGVMDDLYSTREREHAVMDSVTTRSTFLRLLSSILALQEVFKPLMLKWRRQQLDMIHKKTEELRDMHAKLLAREERILTRDPTPYTYATPYSQKRFSTLAASEVLLARQLNRLMATIKYRYERFKEAVPAVVLVSTTAGTAGTASTASTGSGTGTGTRTGIGMGTGTGEGEGPPW